MNNPDQEFHVIGKNVIREEGPGKVTGLGKYAIDLEFPRMLWAKIKRSTRPHAKIINIDISRAQALPGVHAVIVDKDCPQTLFGFGCYDEPLLARGKVRYIGEPVAAVAAESEAIAEQACDLIEIDYEDLPAIFDPWEAFEADPKVIIHEDQANYRRVPIGPAQYDPKHPNAFGYYRIRTGEVSQGFAEADVVLEKTYSNAMMAHATMERHNSISLWDADGKVTAWSSAQAAYPLLNQISEALDIPHSRVRVIIPKYVGGGFGGKIEMKAEGLCAVLSRAAGHRHIKIIYTREESLCWAGVQHPFEMRIKSGVRKDGVITACEMFVLVNGGAYAQHGFLVTRQASYGPLGSYRFPHFKLDNYVVYTNNPPGVAYRGFGNTQIHFGLESHIDELAHAIGMDPYEIRRKNVLKENEINAAGEIQHSVAGAELLDEIKAGLERHGPLQREDGPWRRGRGIAFANKDSVAPSASSAIVKIHNDETVEIRHSAGNIGQGSSTTLIQITAEFFKVGPERVRTAEVDTWVTPYDQLTGSSRLTFAAGNAVLMACEDVKNQILTMAAQMMQATPEELDLADMVVFVKENPGRSMRVKDLFRTVFFTGSFLPTGGELLGKATFTVPSSKIDPETGHAANDGMRKIFSFCTRAAQAVEVAVNIETGQVKLEKIAIANDLGKAINPMSCEGQMHAAISMGLGQAISEELQISEGSVANGDFSSYRFLTAKDAPSNDHVSTHIVEIPQFDGPYKAKGFSEATTSPTAPAIANAIFDAVGLRLRHMPMTPERVLEGLDRLTSADRD
ncbi:deaminase [Rhizobium pisi]|uniref:xanthine dehydrogenase family protein molybdopterin-binding subunit n=1 Tax=Rhizobium TaxID=379 RepID=UPI001032040F|nr:MULTISPECIES: xanthine dehydrogenase family protein molybdopterin-binding subunit [Rhizobium]MBY5806465.1 molybdopterin-dependent oxidoreductase [Rhizobium leguminosarum]TBE73954.1 deaminase [Rhizobium leguminosarum]TCA60943.1 deaminase [Rhizobium pisi]